MPRKPPGTRLTDLKRSAIVSAAVSEFQKHGFAGTSMDRIAAAADVTKRTVYKHFPSKDDLFQTFLDELLSRCGEIEEFSYNKDASLEEQLLVIGSAIAQMITSDEVLNLARVVLARFLQTPEFAAVAAEGQDTVEEGLVKWIQAAKRDGRLSTTSPKQAAKQFTALIKAFAFWPQLMGMEQPLTDRELKRVIKSAVTMFLDHHGKTRD